MKAPTVFTITGMLLIICGLTLIHMSNKTGFTKAIFNTCSEMINPEPVKPYVATKPLNQQYKEKFEQHKQYIRTDKLFIRDIIHVLEPRLYNV